MCFGLKTRRVMRLTDRPYLPHRSFADIYTRELRQLIKSFTKCRQQFAVIHSLFRQQIGKYSPYQRTILRRKLLLRNCSRFLFHLSLLSLGTKQAKILSHRLIKRSEELQKMSLSAKESLRWIQHRKTRSAINGEK